VTPSCVDTRCGSHLAQRPRRLQLAPVHIHASPLGRARGQISKAINARMTSLCADLGTTVVKTPAGLEIPLP